MNLEESPAAAEQPRAIVAGHGTFSAGLVSAVGAITGRAGTFVAMSNTGLGAAEIERMLRETIDTLGVGVIFTDLPMGSCTMAARKVQRTHPAVVLVTGTNLATLLEFVMHVDLPLAEAAERAAAKGRETLKLHEGPRVG
ncbi:MAG: hypothetical protein HYX65_03130 [Gemmatimonadetes bacterium]|nr:hypothetical protein [Gemmatimonadota bacterium]